MFTKALFWFFIFYFNFSLVGCPFGNKENFPLKILKPEPKVDPRPDA